VQWIDEHEPGYVRGMRARKRANDESSKGMSHQHIRMWGGGNFKKAA
jgi:hypothetical protein